jgi:uncharacterized protein YciI
MEFDRFTIALLVLRPDAPGLSAEEEDALQDAHMAHLADMHGTGHLLMAGPLLGEPGRRFRGLSVYDVGPEETRAMAEQDPGVGMGRYTIEVFPWIVPAGAASFSRTRYPRSLAEAEGD